jgi:hypothetical protein
MFANVVSDNFVSLSAVLGLLILRWYLSKNKSSLTARFKFGIDVLIVMLLSRVLLWTTGLSVFGNVTLVAGGIVPLAALILAEGLMRRHAPQVLKWVSALGSFGVFLLAFIFTPGSDWITIYVLIGLQLFVFCGLGGWVVLRDRDCLSGSENLMIDRLSLSLLLVIPFALADFINAAELVPIRLSGIAILFMCWLTLSFSRSNQSHWEIAGSFALSTIAGICAGLALSSIAQLEATTAIQSIVVIGSAVLFAQIYNEQKTLRRDEERQTILQHIANSRSISVESFLEELQRHPFMSEAVVLRGGDLGDFDRDFLNSFDVAPIQKKSQTISSFSKSGTRDHQEQIDWFFKKFDATHVMQVSSEPVLLFAMNLPNLANAPGLELELRVVQRFASLLESEEAGQ